MHRAETRPAPSRRRRRSGSTVGKAPDGSVGDGRRRLGHEDNQVANDAISDLAEAQQASARLWALLREAQEEMERGTTVLGDELSKLWQSLQSVEPARTANGGNSSPGADDCGGGGGAAEPEVEAVRRRADLNRSGDRRDSGGLSNDRAQAATAPKPRLPPDEADKLIAGLGKLQAEMQTEARSFQRRKSDIVKSLGSLRETRCLGRGRGDKDEVVRLEKEAERMRVAIIASRARLLERVRELQRLASGGVRPSAAASESVATTASYHATSVPEVRWATERDSKAVTSRGSSHSLTDLMSAAQMVIAAREELAELQHEIEATKEELARERERTKNAREQASRLEAIRSSAAAVVSRADHDASTARTETEAVVHALENARDGLAAAQATRRTAEEAAESECARLEFLRREVIGLEDDLHATKQKVREEEARAEAARTAAQREEARLADCRDSFGFEVEGLQKGVEELESEAGGWREALQQTRSRLVVEEKQGKEDKRRMDAEKARLVEAVTGLKAEARNWETRLEGLRCQHATDGEKIAREARKPIAELRELKARVSQARSKLQAARTELRMVTAAIEEKAASNDAVEAAAVSLERRVAELEANIVDLKVKRDRVTQEAEAARRRQAEELSRWKEAMTGRLREYEDLSGRVRGKESSLAELEQHAQVAAEQIQQARGDQEGAEDRTAEAMHAAREAARLAEAGKEKAERAEARAAAAETRMGEAVKQLRRVAEEFDAESSCLESVKARLHAAQQAVADVEGETARARQQLAALNEKRREEEGAATTARQRTAALGQEEAELRAKAMAARRDRGEERDAAAASRKELMELREAADQERRVLEGFRDTALAVKADIARKREEDRFARKAADAQLGRLDEIKREVTLLRDERLTVEKSLWSLKSELEALSARRSDTTRRERRREREEGALEARREALVAAAVREEERIGVAKAVKEKLGEEVADLDTRASALAAEVNSATHEASSLREDAALAARRAEEARGRLASIARETAQLSSEVNMLRATKASLESERSGLRHELEVLRGRVKGEWRGKERVDVTPALDLLPRVHPAEIHPVGGGNDAVREMDQRCRDDIARPGLVGGGCGVASSSCRGDCDNLVDVVSEFQGRLRRQVRAALAEGASSKSVLDGGGFPVSRDGEDLVPSNRSRRGERIIEGMLRVEHRRGGMFTPVGSSRDVLGELDKRIGSI